MVTGSHEHATPPQSWVVVFRASSNVWLSPQHFTVPSERSTQSFVCPAASLATDTGPASASGALPSTRLPPLLEDDEEDEDVDPSSLTQRSLTQLSPVRH